MIREIFGKPPKYVQGYRLQKIEELLDFEPYPFMRKSRHGDQIILPRWYVRMFTIDEAQDAIDRGLYVAVPRRRRNE